MACSHLPVSAPNASTFRHGVHKDECTQCFANQVGLGWETSFDPVSRAKKKQLLSQDSAHGIDVCLGCFNGACTDADLGHSRAHFANFGNGHSLVLNIRRVLKDVHMDAPPLKKIAIEAEPSDSQKYETITSVSCLSCGPVDSNASPHLAALVSAVLAATSSQKKSDIQAWEQVVTECEHTKALVQGPPKALESQSLAHCNSCDIKGNLWLCLTCGNLGCGRAQYGGTGGNGHGMAHFDASRHPVSVKLGTITPEGTADIYCYLCDEERLDPHLGAHLKNFGINIAGQEKTEKTLTELQLEQNMKFDFSMTTEDGKELAPLFGPGFTGLKNLGNTCYMASVLQVLFALPAFQDRYLGFGQHHLSVCKDTAASCFHCQTAKLAHGLLSGMYSTPTSSQPGAGQDGIAPAMFKTLTSKGHSEFSTMRQQDAQEYLSHILKLIEQKERAGGQDPSRVFKFGMEQRLQCVECGCVRYVKEPATEALQLPVPAKESDGEETVVPFDACLGQLFGEETREFACPQCKKTTKLTCSFPEVLVTPMSRFIQGSDYVMKKLNVKIAAPLNMDLSAYKSAGPQPGETLFPEEEASRASAEPTVDASALNDLMGMGFPELRCRKALIKTGNNGAEIAMNWLFEHMEDADIDDPIETAPAGGASNDVDYSSFLDMGFTTAQAKKAMSQTGNNIERAVDWLFSHADDSMALDEPAPSSASSEGPSASPKYRLIAFISHRGTSAHCGHYVAHVKKGDQWVLFNDNKVVEVPDVMKAIGEAYIYFYKSEE
ncbi:hypothetical protein HDU81_005241 [Chytriomyces hyalinus]|nr:hypothetical protein HDU81_005241 [Chytriomyces hyalinus]